ncbi:MAG: hypothetical protein CMP23_15865 [Rickettsiales bacterium]|nr:hypothetical protein [Rickettsiales bacterium]
MTGEDSDVFLTVLVPVHNEVANLAPLYAALVESISLLGLHFELLFVDDGSSDGSAALVRELTATDERVLLLQHDRCRGKAAALATGLQRVNGELLIIIDADLQYDPRDLAVLVEGLQSGHDVVSGARAMRLDSRGRRIGSRVHNAVVNLLAGTRFEDHFSGLKGVRVASLRELDLECGRLRVLLAVAALSGLSVCEVPVRHHERSRGSSRYGWRALSVLVGSDLRALLPLVGPLRWFGSADGASPR